MELEGNGDKDDTPYESPFKAGQLKLSDQGEVYRYQYRKHGENNFRLGGRPYFIQDYHYPACCDCKKHMRFILQLDSGIPQENGTECDWGSGGMAYLYWCDNCRISSICWFCT